MRLLTLWICLVSTVSAVSVASDVTFLPFDPLEGVSAEPAIALGNGEDGHLAAYVHGRELIVLDLRTSQELARARLELPEEEQVLVRCLGFRHSQVIVATTSEGEAFRSRGPTSISSWSLTGTGKELFVLPENRWLAPGLGLDDWVVWSEAKGLHARHIADGRRLRLESPVELDRPPEVSGSVAWIPTYFYDDSPGLACLDLRKVEAHWVAELRGDERAVPLSFHAGDVGALPCPPALVSVSQMDHGVSLTGSLDGRLHRLWPAMADVSFIADGVYCYLRYRHCLFAFAVPDMRCDWACLLPIVHSGDRQHLHIHGDLLVARGGKSRWNDQSLAYLIDRATGSVLGKTRLEGQNLVAANRDWYVTSQDGRPGFGAWDLDDGRWLEAKWSHLADGSADNGMALVRRYLQKIAGQEPGARSRRHGDPEVAGSLLRLLDASEPEPASLQAAFTMDLPDDQDPFRPDWSRRGDASLARQYRNLLATDTQLFALQGTMLRCYESTTGKELWQRDEVGFHPRCDGEAMFTVILGEHEGRLLLNYYHYDDEADQSVVGKQAWDPSNGELLAQSLGADALCIDHLDFSGGVVAFVRSDSTRDFTEFRISDPRTLQTLRRLRLEPDIHWASYAHRQQIVFGLREGIAQLDLRTGRGWHLPGMNRYYPMQADGSFIGAGRRIYPDGRLVPWLHGDVLHADATHCLLRSAENVLERWRLDDQGDLELVWSRRLPQTWEWRHCQAPFLGECYLVGHGRFLLRVDAASGVIQEQYAVYPPFAPSGYFWEITTHGRRAFVSTSSGLTVIDLPRSANGAGWRQALWDCLATGGEGHVLEAIKGLQGLSLYAASDPSARKQLAKVIRRIERNGFADRFPRYWQRLLRDDGWVLDDIAPEAYQRSILPDYTSSQAIDDRLRADLLDSAAWCAARIGELVAGMDKMREEYRERQEDEWYAQALRDLQTHIDSLQEGRARSYQAEVIPAE